MDVCVGGGVLYVLAAPWIGNVEVLLCVLFVLFYCFVLGGVGLGWVVLYCIVLYCIVLYCGAVCYRLG